MPIVRIAALLAVCAAAPSISCAGELTPAEASALRAEIQALLEEFNAGNVDAFVEQTHGSLQRLAGGTEAFRKLTQGALDTLTATGVEVLSMEQGQPSPTYVAGDEEVCFVPRVGMLRIGDQQFRSTTFMIAIRKIGGDDWTFLEGAGMRDNPKLLPLLLPKLDPAIELPPNHMEPRRGKAV